MAESGCATGVVEAKMHELDDIAMAGHDEGISMAYDSYVERMYDDWCADQEDKYFQELEEYESYEAGD